MTASHAGAWALEMLTESHVGQERASVRRCFQEVVHAWPGETGEMWWRWCLETGSSLGLNFKILDCSPAEAVELAREGAYLVTLAPGAATEWLLVFGSPRKRPQVARSSAPAQRNAMSPRRLLRLLEECSQAGMLRCVVFDPNTLTQHSLSTRKSQAPFARLQEILKPEWSDIWIVILFAFVVGLLTLATPIAVEAVVNTVAFGRFLQPVIVLAVILFTFLAFSAGLRALQTYVVEIIQRRLFARVAADLAYRLPRTETERADQHYMPELVNRFFDVVTLQKVTAQLLLDGVALVLTTLVGMAVLAFYHPWLFGFDILLLVSIIFLITILGRGAIPSAIKESKQKYHMASWLEDITRCPLAFRADGGIDFAVEQADHLIQEYLEARQTHFRVLMRQILFALGLQAVASTVLLGLGGWLVISGELTLGQLVAAELIVTVIVGGFTKLGKHIESFYDLLASVDKLCVLFDLPRERDHGMLVLHEDAPAAVEVHAATYARPGAGPVFDNVTFRVEPGESLAVVGPSGSGKSTLLDLLYALRTPTAGHLTINGYDPGDVRPDLLRRHVTLVRGAEIFSGTIAENVHLHRTDVPLQAVRDALRQVGLLERVQLLEKDLETPLTSGGAPLTENQCRLLALARGVANQPSLLLIDGLLDSLSDEELAPLLDWLTHADPPWTLIIATGREEIAQRCSQQYRLAASSRRIQPQNA